MISYCDDLLGRLLGTLVTTGVADNTVVVVTSDHGDMLGERGLWYKMSFMEHSARVPLIVYAPGRYDARPGHTTDLAAGHRADPERYRRRKDHAATLDGHLLLPLLEGGAENPEHAIYAELTAEGCLAPLFMIRQGNWKYTASRPDPDQLFDLAADPNEMTNLADHPDHADVVRKFRSMAAARWNPSRLEAEIKESQLVRLAVWQALRKGNWYPWDYQPLRDASEQYMRNHKDLNVLEKT